jgi:hypothetical protein
MDKILDVMEDIKQNITDNEYKIIMESLMKIKNEKEKEKLIEVKYTGQYTQKEFDEMTKVMLKLSIDICFEYTDDENDAVWLDSIKRFTETKLHSYNIGFSGNKLEDYLFQILEENKTIIQDQHVRKIKYRY